MNSIWSGVAVPPCRNSPKALHRRLAVQSHQRADEQPEPVALRARLVDQRPGAAGLQQHLPSSCRSVRVSAWLRRRRCSDRCDSCSRGKTRLLPEPG